jgi:hypothetical protein
MLQQTFCEEIISCNSRFQNNNQLRKAEEKIVHNFLFMQNSAKK